MNSYYSNNVIDDIDMSLVLSPFFNDWYEIVKDILKHDEFQKRKLFNHHHDMSVWDHSILVSFKSYMAARYYSADPRVCAIAGLLHDFYTQAWLMNDELAKLEDGKYVQKVGVRQPLFKMHGFTHAGDAAENYVRFFPELEDEKITNCIKRHMFPLNIVPPRYKEGFIITGIDKLNSVRELPSIKFVAVKAKNKTVGKLKSLFQKN